MTEEKTHSPAKPRGVSEPDVRDSIRSNSEQGRLLLAIPAVQSLLAQFPGRRTHRFLRDLVESPATENLDLKRIKVGLLSSFSIEFLHDSLVALGFANGLRVEIYQPGFGTFRQEMLNPASALYAWAPDAVVLAVEGEDWVPAVFSEYLAPPEDGLANVPEVFGNELRSLARAFRSNSAAALLIHNVALPAWRPLGILDPKTKLGQGELIAALNATVASVARDVADTHVVDYAALVNRHGALNWYDQRMKLYAKAPIASAMQPHLAAEYVKFFRGMKGLAKKCIALDLDNTLWGGIIGEDGLDGIRLGPNYPGSAFAEFQRALLDLQRRGVILAIASKNNPEDAAEVFSKHRSMVLRSEHFADMQIHWEAKSVSLARIAQRLSIGMEHMVFVDDNPVECEEIRRALPMVHVIELPTQPERYALALQELGLFDTPTLSIEDQKRGELYRQRAQAEEVRANMSSVEDYYRDLAMEVEIVSVDRGSLPRAAQLTQKTNQFNVTTFRYTESDVAKRMGEPDWILATTTVKDRFGDNGIVGFTMVRHVGSALEIDTLLLSCRVIGRTVETAMLAHLCDEGRRRGATTIEGLVIPTAKNAPARDVFDRHGFVKVGEDASGVTRWRLSLATASVAWPAWFKRQS
jgi:FkbH-like protein